MVWSNSPFLVPSCLPSPLCLSSPFFLHRCLPPFLSHLLLSCRYKKTQETLSQAGQKTSAALTTVGTAITRRLGDMRYCAAEPKWPTPWASYKNKWAKLWYRVQRYIYTECQCEERVRPIWPGPIKSNKTHTQSLLLLICNPRKRIYQLGFVGSLIHSRSCCSFFLVALGCFIMLTGTHRTSMFLDGIPLLTWRDGSAYSKTSVNYMHHLN